MKNIIRNSLLLLSFIAASMAWGAVPAMNVTVSDASGKAAYKGATNLSGAFATAKLQPGNYVVQFVSKSGSVKGSRYSIVVSAGKKKVVASAVAGEKFGGGGVALKLDVGPGLNITGQVAAEEMVSKSGKKMVWITPQLGSNMPGHWVEEGSAEAIAAKNAGTLRTQDLEKMKEHFSRGPNQ